MLSIDAYSLPGSLPANALSGRSAVAIDILRAGTTIATALHSGAAWILPCVSCEAAMTQAASIPSALLGGERRGLLIEGFDLSNSPEAYCPNTVRDRPIVFSTTNGTAAIEASRTASDVLVSSFSNLSASCQRLESSGNPLALVCAGTNGKPTLEDMLFAGALVNWFQERGRTRLNACATACSELWRTSLRQVQSGASLYQVLCGAQGGKNLIQLGLERDIEYASVIDRFDFVPVLDRSTGRIVKDVDLLD